MQLCYNTTKPLMKEGTVTCELSSGTQQIFLLCSGWKVWCWTWCGDSVSVGVCCIVLSDQAQLLRFSEQVVFHREVALTAFVCRPGKSGLQSVGEKVLSAAWLVISQWAAAWRRQISRETEDRITPVAFVHAYVITTQTFQFCFIDPFILVLSFHFLSLK